MIFAETPRLILRQLEKSDLSRVTELIGDWDVAKWLIRVPFPYSIKDAEEYYEKMKVLYDNGTPQYFAIERKEDRQLMGAVGLHPPNRPNPKDNEIEIGYWLGKPYWGQGFMSEAAATVIDLGFQRPDVESIESSTDPANTASQNVLRKCGLNYLGIFPRRDEALRGGPEITRWELTRRDYETRKKITMTCIDVTLPPVIANRPVLLVAAAALIDGEGRVLLAERPAGKNMAGLWEFPGGKIHTDETPEAALVRELQEELGITTTTGCLWPLTFASHAYDDFHLLMPLYGCRNWHGTPHPHEGQQLAWVTKQQLRDYPMPPADVAIVNILWSLL